MREARPLVRELDPAAADLVEAEPTLKRTVHALNRLFNLLGFNPGGREGPDSAGRDEGYLFHLAWLAHQSVSLFSGQDANGVFRPLVLGGTCNMIAQHRGHRARVGVPARADRRAHRPGGLRG